MRKLLLVVLAALAVASPAWPQANAGVGKAGVKDQAQAGMQIQGQSPADSIRRNIGVTGNSLWTTDPSVTTITYYADIINTGGTGVAPGSASVSAPKDVTGWDKMGLMVYALPSAATVGYDSYAISVRGGYLASADSMASFPIEWPQTQNNATQIGIWADSTGMVAQNITPDLVDNASTFPKAFAVSSEQFIWRANPTDAIRGRLILLARAGVWASAPYLVVRVRPLRGRDNTGAVLASADSTTVRKYRCDLVRLK